MKKRAISVTVSNMEPQTDFVAGMPASPQVALSRGEVLATKRRMPKTISLLTEGTVPTAISEGSREVVEQLERKFGAFLSGFLYEVKTGPRVI